MKRLYIPLPDCPARRQIVSNLLKDQSYELTDEEMDSICKKTDGKRVVVHMYMYIHVQFHVHEIRLSMHDEKFLTMDFYISNKSTFLHSPINFSSCFTVYYTDLNKPSLCDLR